jgi:oligogalacturonide lyase
MSMEIAGHEWWSRDGRTVWYDLQLPKGKDFFVAGYEVATGKRTWYHLERDEWSVHFHSSNDDKLFAGDGGAENMVAKAKDGRWLYLFDPRMVEDDADGTRVDDPDLIQGGWLASRKLVNMKGQDYRLEPNVNFTPDGRYLVFRANFHGGVQTYAVDLASTAD